MDRATLDAAMASTPPEILPVTVRGWGTFHVRELTLKDMDRLNAAKGAATSDEEGTGALALSCASMICDESGNLLYDAKNKKDVEWLAGQGFRRLSKVLEVANSLAGDNEGNA